MLGTLCYLSLILPRNPAHTLKTGPPEFISIWRANVYSTLLGVHSPNLSTIPIAAMGLLQCLPLDFYLDIY